MLTDVKVIIIAILALSDCYDEILNETRYQTAMLTDVKVIIIAKLTSSAMRRSRLRRDTNPLSANYNK